MATPHPCTPDQLVDALAKLVAPLVEQAPPTLMSIGFPGVVRNNRILTAPHFGVEGWHDIPLADSLAQRLGGLPVRMINDAEMQGFAAIEGHGLEFVLTLGTGAGTAMFRDGELMPHLELAHHPVSKKGVAYDEYIGDAAREKAGNKRWNRRVKKVIGILDSLVNYDKLWIGGGNAARLKFDLPAERGDRLERCGDRRRRALMASEVVARNAAVAGGESAHGRVQVSRWRTWNVRTVRQFTMIRRGAQIRHRPTPAFSRRVRGAGACGGACGSGGSVRGVVAGAGRRRHAGFESCRERQQLRRWQRVAGAAMAQLARGHEELRGHDFRSRRRKGTGHRALGALWHLALHDRARGR